MGVTTPGTGDPLDVAGEEDVVDGEVVASSPPALAVAVGESVSAAGEDDGLLPSLLSLFSRSRRVEGRESPERGGRASPFAGEARGRLEPAGPLEPPRGCCCCSLPSFYMMK